MEQYKIYHLQSDIENISNAFGELERMHDYWLPTGYGVRSIV